ncbi:DUF418 domain-containing protein [Kangiella koreensis]|uniref:DUF418 domain-containing protein n=1 Tax=Kangiella koreensis (strain DSM 16069 / JCM 12317 / KCTC 12182 / SW-125) TaxID=523791 RepID=C7R943_KANKD|nr:DUF418 domain-containing protein [Kangiella koreensis]ACV27833.1 protein of unknown function DUF405 [Kangiella koreensis DSM 16069]
MTTALLPTSSEQRYQALDLIRGVAVLGILIMNIYAFSNIFAYYMNPYALGEPSDSDVWVWSITHIFADQKFYTLFSMLFGAGIMLMAERAKAQGISAAKYHYRRIFWLLIFGLIHALFIWLGDILFIYACMGLWVFLFTDTTPKTKLITGIVLVLLYSAYMSMASIYIDRIPAEDLEFMLSMFYPDQATIQEETLPYLTSYAAQVSDRVDFFKENVLSMGLTFGIFRIGGSMLIGMALYQFGVLTAARSSKFYLVLLFICFAIGFGLTAYDMQNLIAHDFAFEELMFSYMTLTNIAALFIALGYIALLALWCKSSSKGTIRKAFQAVGRMAFTNYIAQSLICTTLFYSFGFGLFAELSRLQLMGIVAIVFLLQLVWSPWWLKRYHYGPLEWLWRSLTYAKIQAFRKH